MKNRIKINGTIMFLCLLVIILFPRVFLRSCLSPLDSSFKIIGVTALLLGQLIRVSSRGYKAENSKGGNFLIKNGPYALVRNPMYLGIILMGVGIVLFLFKWWVFFIFLVFFVFRYIILISKEEKILIEKFGQEYKDYQKNTPRLFPKINFIIRNKNYLPLKFAWFKKELASFVSILLVLFGIKLLIKI